MPALLHIVLAMIAGGLAGAVWAGIAGALKAIAGTNEVISTIMLNWIAIWFAIWLFNRGGPLQNTDPDQQDVPVSNDIVEGAKLPVFWGDPILQGLHIGIFIALAAVLVFWVILNRTTLGYEVRAVGFNPDAAAASGISVKRNYIVVMAICGAFAGLAGVIDVLGWQFRIATNDIRINDIGFTAIAVALLGRNTAIGTIFSALLFGALDHGHVGAQPRPDDLRARAGGEPDARHPGPRRAAGLDRRARRVPVAAAKAPAALPEGGGGMTPKHVGWAGVALAVLAFFVAVPPIMLRSPVVVVVHRAGGDRRGLVRVRARPPATRRRRDRRRLLRDRRRRRLDAVGRGQPRARGRLGRAAGRDPALRHAAAVRRARRPLLRACRRHQHRPRGHDAGRCVLRRARRRQDGLLGARDRDRDRRRRGDRRLHALFAVTLRADQIVSGTAINLLALGITGYLYVDIYGTDGTPDDLPQVPDVNLPIDDDPVLRRRLRPAQPARLDRAGDGAR